MFENLKTGLLPLPMLFGVCYGCPSLGRWRVLPCYYEPAISTFGHGFAVMSGRYDTPDEQVSSPLSGLAAALSNTMGLGISAWRLTVKTGSLSAVFWMWMSAVVGIATNFLPAH